ncbi:uncharacterized protein BJX67DRAFT_372788 [Aspergillus lucknowensis]|uniref:Uncharacterized protein n=1 Tax=Aspergillus lucknowensis TaxID=176173 RepID=A0ABR4LPT6_9EURO
MAFVFVSQMLQRFLSGPQYDEANETGHKKVETIYRDAQGQFISGELTRIVELLDDGTVLKSLFPKAEMENNILDIAKEASIYYPVGPLRGWYGYWYMKNRDLKTYIQAHSSILIGLKLNNSIIHCDGSKPASGEGTRFYLPRYWRDLPTVATDLFALRSTLYKVFQETSPYEEIPRVPYISTILYGKIIKQYWFSQADLAKHVQASIQDIIYSNLNADYIPHLDGLDTGQDMLIDPVRYP